MVTGSVCDSGMCGNWRGRQFARDISGDKSDGWNDGSIGHNFVGRCECIWSEQFRFMAETAAATTTSGGSRAATGSSSATTTSTSTRIPESVRDSQQVGAGTAALGVALLALLAWFALRRRKRARVLGDETQQYHDQPAMYGKPSIYGSVPNSELADPEIFEPEMGTGHATGELPGHGALATRPGRGDVHELG